MTVQRLVGVLDISRRRKSRCVHFDNHDEDSDYQPHSVRSSHQTTVKGENGIKKCGYIKRNGTPCRNYPRKDGRDGLCHAHRQVSTFETVAHPPSVPIVTSKPPKIARRAMHKVSTPTTPTTPTAPTTPSTPVASTFKTTRKSKPPTLDKWTVQAYMQQYGRVYGPTPIDEGKAKQVPTPEQTAINEKHKDLPKTLSLLLPTASTIAGDVRDHGALKYLPHSPTQPSTRAGKQGREDAASEAPLTTPNPITPTAGTPMSVTTSTSKSATPGSSVSVAPVIPKSATPRTKASSAGLTDSQHYHHRSGPLSNAVPNRDRAHNLRSVVPTRPRTFFDIQEQNIADLQLRVEELETQFRALVSVPRSAPEQVGDLLCL